MGSTSSVTTSVNGDDTMELGSIAAATPVVATPGAAATTTEASSGKGKRSAKKAATPASSRSTRSTRSATRSTPGGGGGGAEDRRQTMDPEDAQNFLQTMLETASLAPTSASASARKSVASAAAPPTPATGISIDFGASADGAERRQTIDAEGFEGLLLALSARKGTPNSVASISSRKATPATKNNGSKADDGRRQTIGEDDLQSLMQGLLESPGSMAASTVNSTAASVSTSATRTIATAASASSTPVTKEGQGELGADEDEAEAMNDNNRRQTADPDALAAMLGELVSPANSVASAASSEPTPPVAARTRSSPGRSLGKRGTPKSPKAAASPASATSASTSGGKRRRFTPKVMRKSKDGTTTTTTIQTTTTTTTTTAVFATGEAAAVAPNAMGPPSALKPTPKGILSVRKQKKAAQDALQGGNVEAPTPRKSVLFGAPQATEFKSTEPTTALTPMHQSRASACFPMHSPASGASGASDHVTLNNSRVLAAWEDTSAAAAVANSAKSKSPRGKSPQSGRRASGRFPPAAAQTPEDDGPPTLSLHSPRILAQSPMDYSPMSIDTATPGSVRAADVQDDDEAEDAQQEEVAAAAAAPGAIDESSMEMDAADDVAAAMEGVEGEGEGEGEEASPLNRSTASFKSQLDAVASPSESSFDGGEFSSPCCTMRAGVRAVHSCRWYIEPLTPNLHANLHASNTPTPRSQPRASARATA